MFSFVNEPGHISMAELLARAVDSHPDYEAVASSNSVVKMPISISEESNTYLDSGRVRCRIEEWTFVLVITFTHEARPNNVSQYAYRQEIEGDVLVWVSSFEMTVDGETTRYELWTKNVNGALEMQIRKYVNPLRFRLIRPLHLVIGDHFIPSVTIHSTTGLQISQYPYDRLNRHRGCRPLAGDCSSAEHDGGV